MLMPVPSPMGPDSLRSAEGRLLGWVMGGNDPASVLGEVAPSDFSIPGNRLLCALLIGRWQAGAPLDLSSVGEVLMESDPEGIIPKSGGWEALSEFVGYPSDSLKPDALAALIRTVKRSGNGERTRRAMQAVDLAIQAGDYEAVRQARGILQGYLDEAGRLDGRGGGGPVLEESAVVWSRALDGINEDMRAKDGPLGLGFGVPALDAALRPGLRPGRLWVIGGGTGEGKTVLALQMALRAARRGLGVLFLSLEMPPEELHERAVSMETTVPAYRIQRRELAWAADQEALVGWEPPTSFLAPLVPGMKAREIPGLVKDARQWFGAKGYSLALLVVDHLQLIPNGDRPESRALEVKAAANQCKETALGAGGGAPLAVLALSQLRRARDAKNPSPSDLKESGSIEEAADAVLLLARKRDCNGRLLPEGEIYIGKNRGGLAHDVVAITFNPERLWFE